MFTIQYEEEISIYVGDKELKGDLHIPAKCKGVVIFSHGSGSSRYSPRNKKVADYLFNKKIGTLLLDLLTVEEDMEYQNRFNIHLLTKRLIAATQWVQNTPVTLDCQIGYFGASTGAASALSAASQIKGIKAVVCRGGRPDLTIQSLPFVKSPTLLLVGSLDTEVIKLNQVALDALNCPKKLEIIYGAGHLFEAPGALDKVSFHAYKWFDTYFT